MADTAGTPASQAAPTKKAAKKAAKPKAAATHPKYNEMISKAIDALGERKGSSRQAILKYICANFRVGDKSKANVHVKLALKRMTTSGDLKHVKGSGASGSFRLAEKPKATKKKPSKKATPKKKPAAKKVAKKPAAKRSPKKAKKPAAKKAKKAKPVAAKKAKPAKKTAAKKKPAAKKATKAKKPAKK